MTPSPLTVRQALLDPMLERAVTTTAQMFGLSQAAVATLVLVGLPMMARLADDNPDLFTRMHAATRVALPEPIPEFYVRMALTPSLRQSVVDDHKATYGTLLERIHREAARHAGMTDGQARDVLAAILPAVNHVLVQANNNLDDETKFGQQLKALSA